ncbi:phosphopantetheine-binding protein [Streptomyces capparidis]
MKTHEQRVKEIVARHFGIRPDAVGYSSHFVQDLGADEESRRELLRTIQRELRCDIFNSDADAMMTPKQIVEYVQEYYGE